jgi:hypothetical protein
VAVYAGARPRSTLLPQRRRVADAPTLPRRRIRGAVRARRRTNGLAVILGGIVLVFLLAFFSLAQTVRVSATGYDINRLLIERDDLVTRKQELLSDLNRLGGESAIRKLSLEAGLGQLGEPRILTGN